MSQFALPLRPGPESRAGRIVLGSANQHVVEALTSPESWPFRTAVLAGPPRSGKSLMARWFVEQGLGDAIDDADCMDETEVFHRWNRAQESGTPLLLVSRGAGWEITLPDLRSRIGAALHLVMGAPDDDMVAALISAHAEQCGLALGEGALTYLTPRVERSFSGIERLVAAIDRISLERKQPATQAIWRDALEAVQGAEQPRLF
ncbi:hypothetical protein NT2_01_01290 [Caenibius tardaugens NBRC 16725]|uniref:ATPase n=1 Tax=Caenibius tardaugens NBRC 16725 TaxID=1219035 RepID=U2Y351_9SPHN|nr:hypothetical protein [Caenibius tardaugens]AZI37378.1 ATPase [Caenibius tardaugens NBRC 16725]GAD47361.1 hypothetical protein NT2_01_01290 [Caenibius tardaugens NBRC 16725]